MRHYAALKICRCVETTVKMSGDLGSKFNKKSLLFDRYALTTTAFLVNLVFKIIKLDLGTVLMFPQYI